MTLNNLELNEQQRAVLGALTNGNCYLKLETDRRYQLYHEEQAIGYSLSVAGVETLVTAGLVGKVETVKLTAIGREWASQNIAL